jgi:ribosomal protein S18 acetylase RimI-like enzyme
MSTVLGTIKTVIKNRISANVSPKVTFRFPKISDLPRIVEINVDGVKSEKKFYPRFFAKEIIPKKRAICAIINGKLIGSIFWYDEFLGRPKQWYVGQIIVDKDFRGMGIGDRLLKRFLKHARRKKAERVFCDIHNDNYPSLQIALKSGALVSGYIQGVEKKRAKDEWVILRYDLC